MITNLKLKIQSLVSALVATAILLLPLPAFAAGSITASGGGSFTNGSTFTITVRASGATFDSLQGIISVSGPVSIVSFSAGSATWLPGKSPANNTQFVGITGSTSSLTVATIKLKGTKEGSGKVTVSGVRLASSGAEVGTSGGSTAFTITRAPTPPGGVSVSSSTHPNPDETYEATTVELAWAPPSNGANGYSYLLDQAADTVPPQAVKDQLTAAKYENLTVGTHYFHIRANNSDGWGSPTHFKINIKPKLDSSIAAPTITEITTTSDFTNDIENGTLTGIVFRGTGPAGYVINVMFAPDLALPSGKYSSPTATDAGAWEFLVTDPVKAGFYKLTVQGNKDGTVTPASAATPFEVRVSDGGQVSMVTADDSTASFKQAEQAKVAAAQAKRKLYISAGGALVILVLGALAVGWFMLRRRMFGGLTAGSGKDDKKRLDF